MANKPRTRQFDDDEIEEALLIEGAKAEDITGITDDTEAIEKDILAEVGAADRTVEYYINVHRVPRDGKLPPKLFTCSPDEFKGVADRVLEHYGTGTYEARVYKNKGLWRRIAFAVEAPRATPHIQAPSANDSALVTMVRQQGEALQALLAQVAAAKAPQSTGLNIGGVAALLTATAPIVTALLGARAPASGGGDQLGLLTKMMEFAREMNSDGKEKGAFDIISDLLNSPLIAQMANQPPAVNGGPLPNAPVPQPVPVVRPMQMQPQQPPQPVQQTQAPLAATPEMKALQEQLAFLVTRAERNSDISLYADVIEDAMSPTDLQMFLAQSDPVLVLSTIWPPVAQHRAWFTQVIGLLTESREAVDVAAHVPTGQPANVDPANDPQRQSGGANDTRYDGDASETGEGDPIN